MRSVIDKGPLFLAEDRGAEARGDDGRLSHYGIRKALGRLVKAVAIAKRLAPPALRHTFGMVFQGKKFGRRRVFSIAELQRVLA